jgi:hypothetical protein
MRWSLHVGRSALRLGVVSGRLGYVCNLRPPKGGPAKEHVRQSQTAGRWIPARREFLQGFFRDPPRSGDSHPALFYCRSSFTQIPCDARAGNLASRRRDFFASDRELSEPRGKSFTCSKAGHLPGGPAETTGCRRANAVLRRRPHCGVAPKALRLCSHLLPERAVKGRLKLPDGEHGKAVRRRMMTCRRGDETSAGHENTSTCAIFSSAMTPFNHLWWRTGVTPWCRFRGIELHL